MQNLSPSTATFSATLYHKAENYFQARPNGRFGNTVYALKASLILGLYLASYAYFLQSGDNFSSMLLASILLAFCHVLIPVNLAHDGIHNAVSRHQWINTLCRYGIDLTGGNSYMYTKKHLEAHQDKENGSKTKAIETQALLLQVKDAGKAVNLPWFFYLFYAEYMVFYRDFALFFQAKERIPVLEFVKLFLFKATYISAFFVVPFLVMGAIWWQIIACLLLMYLFVTALLVILLLMPTEKMENSKATANNDLNDQWAIEVLAHNVDFSPKIKGLNLLSGGANLNVVHYLFPEVNHVHYSYLAQLIEETATEFGLAYRKQAVSDVFGIHYNYLKNIQHSN